MDENKSFIDPKTFLSIFIVVVGWVFWQQHMTKKYGDRTKVEAIAESQVPSGNIQNNKKAVAIADIAQPEAETTVVQDKKVEMPENTLKFSDDIWSFDISSKGMGVKHIIPVSYTHLTLPTIFSV